jgi:hypothetical protein
MKRIELNANYGEFQSGVTVAFEDDEADSIVKRGRGKLAANQRVFGHIDEMPRTLQEKSIKALEVADRAGTYRDQQARAAATAPFRDSK